MYRRKHIVMVIMCLTSLSICAQTGKGTLHLFPDEAKAIAPPVVFDFLERYLYEINQSKRGYDFYQKMADDKVLVREGSLENIKRLSPTVPFFITRYEDKGYEVSWTDTITGRTLLSMQFPIQFELLLGKPKDEMEKTMKGKLKACSDTLSPENLLPDSLESVNTEGDVFRSATTEHYYVESLNTAKYYINLGEEGGCFLSFYIPLFSSKYKGFSAANLFHGVIKNTKDYQLHIEQHLYGYKQENYTIKLNQWLNYCRDNNLTIYFGIEEERKDGLKALLIAANRDLAYNHVMSIIIPDNFTEKRSSVLKATLNAFIPTNNVKDLYQQYTKKEKKVL